MSIRLRLTLWYTALLGISMIVFGWAVYFFLSYNLYSSVESQLLQKTDEVYSQIEPTFGFFRGQPAVGLALPPLDEFENPGVFMQVINANGQLLKTSSKAFPLAPDMLKKAQQPSNQGGYWSRLNVSGGTLLVRTRPIILPIGDKDQFYGVLQVAAVVNGIDNMLDKLLYILVSVVIVAIVLGVTIGLFLARKALRPIEQVIAAADLIQNGEDLNTRIDYDGPPDEIGRLTDTINGMIGRIRTAYGELEEAYGTQRRFVSDASHELRTPLTTIRGNVDLLEKMWRQSQLQIQGQAQGGPPTLLDGEKLEMSLEAMHDIAGEAARMSRLVGDLLALARADAGFVMEKSDIELKPVVEEVVRRAQLLPKRVDWRSVDLNALEGAIVHGNRDYLQQLLFIFIENAFKYTEKGFVLLDVVRKHRRIGIRIEDTGIGMNKEDIPHIFERFYRADKSRGQTSGTGLGLSIAQWIIDEHGGSVEVTTREGVGTTFLVWLPARFLPNPDSGIMKEIE